MPTSHALPHLDVTTVTNTSGKPWTQSTSVMDVQLHHPLLPPVALTVAHAVD